MTFSLCDYMGVAPRAEDEQSLSLVKAAKRGEGSRGGHIIGHTKSGKAIYTAQHSKYEGFKHLRGPHAEAGVFRNSDHNAEQALQHFSGFSAEDHLDAAALHQHLADAADVSHRATPSAAPSHGFTLHTARLYEGTADGHAHAAFKLGQKKMGRAADSRLNKPIKSSSAGAGLTRPTKTPGPTVRTSSGKEIPSLDSPSYKGVGFARESGRGSVGGSSAYQKQKNKKSDETMARNFAHYNDEDHDEAAQHHLRLAQTLKGLGKHWAAQRADDISLYHSFGAIRHREKNDS